MHPTLLLYGNLKSAPDQMARQIDDVVVRWHRTTGAYGGFTLGEFELDIPKLSSYEVVDFFNTNLGHVVKEQSLGGVTWEGFIFEMRLMVGGVTYLRSFRGPSHMRNICKVWYSTKKGEVKIVGPYTDAASQAIYGDLTSHIILQKSGSAAAAAIGANHIRQAGFPRTWLAGGITAKDQPRAGNIEKLQVTVAGFWNTFNFRYHEGGIDDAEVDAMLLTLVNESEHITPYRIDTNDLIADLNADPLIRIGDGIDQLIGVGNADGDFWMAGVYEDRRFYYQKAPTNVTHYLYQGQLTDMSFAPVEPTLVRPGFWVRQLDAPLSILPPAHAEEALTTGVGYVDQVEYFGDSDELKLRLSAVQLGADPAGVPGIVGSAPDWNQWFGDYMQQMLYLRSQRNDMGARDWGMNPRLF